PGRGLTPVRALARSAAARSDSRRVAPIPYPDQARPKHRGRFMARRRKSKAVPFKAADVANIAKANPYIQRLIDDPHLRENVQKAIESGKSAYGRLSNGK